MVKETCTTLLGHSVCHFYFVKYHYFYRTESSRKVVECDITNETVPNEDKVLMTFRDSVHAWISSGFVFAAT